MLASKYIKMSSLKVQIIYFNDYFVQDATKKTS